MSDNVLTRFRKALFAKLRTVDESKGIKEEYDVAQELLILDMAETGDIGRVTGTDEHGPGKTLGLQTGVFWSSPADRQEELFALLRAIGLGHLIETVVKDTALRKALNDELSTDDGIVSRDADGKIVVPPEFFDADGEPIIRFFEKRTISVRANNK